MYIIMSRTVEVSVDPGTSPLDRYAYGDRVESTVGLNNLKRSGQRPIVTFFSKHFRQLSSLSIKETLRLRVVKQKSLR